MKLISIEYTKDFLEFSAGHFTIFSPMHREKMHGHNYMVHAKIFTEMREHGITFDYAIYRKKLRALCNQLNGYFLLPTQSPYLKIESDDQYYYAYFNQEKLIFPKSDILLLPIRNTTIEELGQWFLDQLLSEKEEIKKYLIHKNYY